MLWSAEGLRGYSVRAMDGRLGKIENLYFDDHRWTVRYFVVETSRLFGRRVLISPQAAGRPDTSVRELPVSLTREKIKHSPDIDLHRPVSRQHESDLHDYYAWVPYWGLHGAPPAAAGPAPTDTGDPALRNAHEVTGYHIGATDGTIGHVADFLVEDGTWIIRYMVADTRNWLPGKKVLLAPAWVRDIDWAEREVYVDLTQGQIEGCPEYDPNRDVERSYEDQIHRYFAMRPYW